MPQAAYVRGLLAVLAVAVTIGTVVGAIFLRAGVAFYNKIAAVAKSPSSTARL
jgi:hypothetical protein